MNQVGEGRGSGAGVAQVVFSERLVREDEAGKVQLGGKWRFQGGREGGGEGSKGEATREGVKVREAGWRES